MASTPRTDASTPGSPAQEQAAEPKSIIETAATRTHEIADAAGAAAGDVVARVPDVAAGTRDAFAEANRLARGGSDQMLQLVAAASVGFSAGLFAAGAHRLFILAALAPAALAGATLYQRNDPGVRTSATRSRVQGT